MEQGKKTAPQERGAERRRGSRSAEVISVIAVRTVIGTGTELDPNRVITEYWSLKGELLAVNDPDANVRWRKQGGAGEEMPTSLW